MACTGTSQRIALLTCSVVVTFMVMVGQADVANSTWGMCPDGGFEDGQGAWSLSDPSYSVQKGVGRDGSAGLVFDCQKPAKHKIPSYSCPAKPGHAYRFTGWLKRETVTNVVQIVLSWHDAKGVHMGQQIGVLMANNDGIGGGWCMYEGVSPHLPEGVSSVRIFAYVRDFAGGRFVLDDFCVEELPAEPLGTLFCSAYREMASEGTVKFLAPLRLRALPSTAGVHASFAYLDADGNGRKKDMELDVHSASCLIDVKDMALGRQTVRCSLVSDAGDDIAASTLEFTRCMAKPRRTVDIDSHNRLVVGGEPFFPIGIYWGTSIPRKDWRKAMEPVKGSPFNMAMVYDVNLTEEDLDFFMENGLLVKFNLKDVYTAFPQVHPPEGVNTEADEERFVASVVNRFKSHPAIIMWYLNDEFPTTMFPRVKRRHEFIRALDPDHPTAICLNMPKTVGEFMGAFDCIETDPYPMPDRPIREAAEWARQTREGAFGLRPMIQTVQAYAKKWFRSGAGDGLSGKGRMPTREEMRLMSWQQIIEGANGVSYFSYSCIYANANGEEFDKIWGELVTVAGEIKRLSPVLLSIESAPKVLEVTDDAIARTWRIGGEKYLAVAGVSGKGGKACVRIEGEYSSVTPELGPNGTLVAPGTLDLDMPPMGVAVLRLK